MYVFIHFIGQIEGKIMKLKQSKEKDRRIKAVKQIIIKYVYSYQSINQIIKQKDHEATYIASNKQQLAINFTVHKT